jgi:hypothetical protein
MRRIGYIVLLAAVLAWAVAAIVSGSATLGVSNTSATTHDTASTSSPRCVPATLEHSARLPGTDVDVSPAPGTGTASPYSQISFLGTSAASIQSVSVTGSRSGGHGGHVQGYSQGDGGSFVPAQPFDPGERVHVQAVIRVGSGARRVAFGFRVDTPYPTASP